MIYFRYIDLNAIEIKWIYFKWIKSEEYTNFDFKLLTKNI